MSLTAIDSGHGEKHARDLARREEVVSVAIAKSLAPLLEHAY
jgi:hypothetical protein